MTDMTDDRENEIKAEESTTEETEIPDGVWKDRWKEFDRQSQRAMLEECKIDVSKAPKRKKIDKFDRAKGKKETLKADYEAPGATKVAQGMRELPLLTPSAEEVEETTTAVMPESSRPTPMRPPAEPEVETQETTVPRMMGPAASEAMPRNDRLTPTLPPTKSAYKQTLVGVAPEANHEERRKSEPGRETPETKGNTARMPAVVPGRDSTPPPPSAKADKDMSPETPASKCTKMQPVVPEADENALFETPAPEKVETKGNTARMPAVVPGRDCLTPPSLPADSDKITSPETPASKRAKIRPVAKPINPRPVLTRKPPVKEVVKAERVGSSARKWGVYVGIAVAAVAVVGLVVVAVTLKREDKKDASADASVVASGVPVAISPPPPSATSPPVLQVAESDASDVASHHDASSVAPATPVPTVTSTRKSMVRRSNREVAPPVATVVPPVVTTVPDAAPVVTATSASASARTPPAESNPTNNWQIRP